ncbi:MAG TPA: ATP-binding protein [Ignavibacteria bacterium]|nr:ATP-binding protein [Ignavibacteria bacterium]
MKFYNREKELAFLNEIEQASVESAQMTFIVGRRRIGKTSLVIKSIEQKTSLYFFIAKKSEPLLCDEFVIEIKRKLNVEIFGELKSFKAVFGYLIELSKTTHFTLIIDEFQEFYTVNPSVYSDMQNIWDANKASARINLILCGSVYSLMTRIFEQSKEPLFGRATKRLFLKEFNVDTIKEILADNYPNYTAEDLLAFYMVSGGVAKYVELLVEAKAFTLKNILDEVFSENSLFLDEGKNVLIDEFGKDYGNYFSILSLIASSKTSRPEIESILEIQTGGYLDKLEKEFKLIRKIRPVFAKPNSRSVKYFIQDNFLNFWFRFIYKYSSAIEIGNLNYVKNIVLRDYKTYSGKVLEKYFTSQLRIHSNYSTIGPYWEKANQNEIDIIAINDIKKRIVIVEVKRQRKNINLLLLQKKASAIMQKYNDYKIDFKGLSMADM